MAKSSLSIILVILLWGLTLSSGKKLLSHKSRKSAITALAPASTDGICSSMVKTQGYTCEEHLVTTKDGYILNMPRIPVGRSRGPPSNRPPVLLQHGLFMVTICSKSSYRPIFIWLV
ncbi:hypothetical protein RIF29_17633 [Crotalaria pallida]|uniref:Partial AB-hydrolase lipase domain-containing protein n=1 Tax=Crotalaria pallida TaxID=3830 RepID=A0AAN9FPE1_CROPI